MKTTVWASSTPRTTPPCVDSDGNLQPGFSDPKQCAAAGVVSNDPAGNSAGTYNGVLTPYDLTRGGGLYRYFGHTDVKELALYAEDQIKTGNWLFNVGIRGDLYNGLTVARQGGATRLRREQRQADQHGAPCFLCAHFGNAVQREPGAVQFRLLQCRSVPAPRLHARRILHT